MEIGVPQESISGERRVALVPDVVKKLVNAGHNVTLATDAGLAAGFPDAEFEKAGAIIARDSSACWGQKVIVKVGPPTPSEIEQLAEKTVLVGLLAPLTNTDTMQAIARRDVTAFALEAIPRISRAQAMDALSSQATVSGYRAALIGATELQRFYPLLMTAAGTVPPAQVLVLGAGVAGLQAIATARRLGASVTGYDVRSAVAEQVRSLGAKFLDLEAGRGAEGEGGYARDLTPEEQAAQQQELSEKIAKFDVVITTALVPGRPAPKLIPADAVHAMKRGSVIVDLAGEAGGNCALCAPGETVVTDNGVTVIAPLNLPSTMAEHASHLYARNIAAVLELFTGENGELVLNFDDEIVSGSCITRDGEIVHPGVAAAVGAR